MKYLGNYAEDFATLNFKFSTHKADGTPITLGGTPVVKVWKGSATDSEVATGVTLSVDFDGVTGLHNVLIDLSSAAFYAVGFDYSVVITTGTVDGVSVVGTVLAVFSIENRFAEVDVTKILGTLLTESSAGYLTAAFKKFFDVMTPVLTAASVNQSGDGFASLGTPVAMDGGTASIVGMLTKMADDNGGATFNAGTDSLNKLNTAVQTGVVGTVQAGANVEVDAGMLISGTYASTYLSNGVSWVTAPISPGGLDAYLEFTLVATQYINSLTIRGYFNATPARNVNVFAYNYVTNGWDQISDSVTRMNHATANQLYSYTLLPVHRKADGQVRIRFYSTSVSTGDRLNIDQCLVNVATTGASVDDIATAVYNKLLTVVYEGGVWIDTVNGVAGTVLGVNGTVVNPVDTYADALLLAANLGVKKLYFRPAASIILGQNHDGWRFIGPGTIDLSGESIADAQFEGSHEISGSCTGDHAHFRGCSFGNIEIGHAYFYDCLFKGTFTLVATKEYYIQNSFEGLHGVGSMSIVFKASCFVHARNWRGSIYLIDLASTNEVEIDGAGLVTIGATCNQGSVIVRGQFTIEDLVAGGFVVGGGTLSDSARWAEDQSIAAVTGNVVFKKNVARPNFAFPMYDGLGALKSGLTVAVEVRKDAGLFVALAGAVNEITDGGSPPVGTGWYTVDFAQAETNAATIALSASATGANPTCLTILTQV